MNIIMGHNLDLVRVQCETEWKSVRHNGLEYVWVCPGTDPPMVAKHE